MVLETIKELETKCIKINESLKGMDGRSSVTKNIIRKWNSLQTRIKALKDVKEEIDEYNGEGANSYLWIKIREILKERIEGGKNKSVLNNER